MSAMIQSATKSLPRSLGDWFILGVLLLFASFFLAPIYIMGVTGLKASANVSLSSMWNLPATFDAGGFFEAWRRLTPSLLNSLQMTVPATLISCAVGAINGYIFSKWRFKGSNVLFIAFVFGMFIPYQSILIPLILFLQQVKLYGTIYGLIVVHVIYGIPITALIFRNFFNGIPNELLEAARMDGAGVIRCFWNVMLPLARPAFVVVAIYQFTNIWNDFLFGVTIVPNPNAQPVTVALNNLSGSFSVDWNVVMAGALVAALPTVLIYIFLGRFFIQGMLAGSVKG